MIDNPWFIPSALGTVLLLQVILLISVSRLSGRVSRLLRQRTDPSTSRRRSGQPDEHDEPISERRRAAGEFKSSTQSDPKGFGEFLAEDPSRRDLSKKEQSAAFRRWRAEKGMNWQSRSDPE